VELLGYYSNLVDWADKLDHLSKFAGQRQEPALHGVVRRLKHDEVSQLVASYEAGATVCQLSTQFNIHRTTVSAHLRRQGARVRLTGMTDEQIAEAASLYKQEWSLAKVGEHFGLNGTTVWRALKAYGVPMRHTYTR
jgi:hypothetical protein